MANWSLRRRFWRQQDMWLPFIHSSRTWRRSLRRLHFHAKQQTHGSLSEFWHQQSWTIYYPKWPTLIISCNFCCPLIISYIIPLWLSLAFSASGWQGRFTSFHRKFFDCSCGWVLLWNYLLARPGTVLTCHWVSASCLVLGSSPASIGFWNDHCKDSNLIPTDRGRVTTMHNAQHEPYHHTKLSHFDSLSTTITSEPFGH